jgi:multidrug efflux pump subunit AcrA (membrane-fusion protein)
MRFLARSLIGVFLLSLTVGLIAVAGTTVYRALETRWADVPGGAPERERIFAVNAIEVQPETVAPTIEVFGEVRSRRRLELRAAAQGEVVHLADAFDEGGVVQAGDLLLRIDPVAAQSALAVAVADLREAEADAADAARSLTLARDELAAAEAQTALRVRALERQRDLLARGVGTDANVEIAELAVSAADQVVLSRRQAEAQAEARIDQTANTVERQGIALAEAQRRLDETEVFAAFDGILTDVDLVVGRLVNANERLGELVDPTDLEVAFRVSTAQYARLTGPDGRIPDAPVTASLDVLGLDLTAAGTISRESATVAEGQTGRLLFARLGDAQGFRPGDLVSVAIQEPALDRVAVLPASALGPSNDVLVIGPEDRLEVRQVELLRRQGDDVLIAAATLEGERVVAERTPLLGAGIRVRALEPVGSEPAAEPEEELVALDPDRRARLVAFVESNTRMPTEARERILNQLSDEKVPAEMVNRIEARMGG